MFGCTLLSIVHLIPLQLVIFSVIFSVLYLLFALLAAGIKEGGGGGRGSLLQFLSHRLLVLLCWLGRLHENLDGTWLGFGQFGDSVKKVA